jgi:purine-binding chemotaxis protein CheW
MRFLTFFLNQDRYAVSVAVTREVNRMVDIRIVPKAPEYVLGLINLHGLINPVLNLKELLNIKPSQLASHSRWIAVEHGGLSVCLAVDKLDRIRRITREKLYDIPTLSKGPQTEYLQNCFKVEDKIVPVLAAGNLLADKEREVITHIVNTFNFKNCQPAP